MSEAAAELSVIIKGKEVGLKSLLAALERDLKQTDRAAEKTSTALGNGLASAEQRAANSALTLAAAQARLARAQGDTAGATKILQTALTQNAAAGERQILAIQTQVAGLERLNSSGAALPRTFAGLTTEMQSLAASTLSVGAGIGVAVAAAQSFADAFNFKAELDATTASVNIQLKGVRDSGQVWAEAASFANQYKLTQAETTATVQASIGILKQSKASVEDTFGVLQRLTVLAPGKSIQDAAFSVRELASGDITSIAEQFNISRGRATEMRDAIREGADVVQVLSQFLSEAGVSMDTLKIRTEGALGAQKELAIAQEQLKLAQAEFAQGPGLQILNTQITATTGLTRVLTSDFASMGESLRQATADNNPFVNWITGATVLQAGLDALTGSQQAQTEAALVGTSGGLQWGAAATQAAVAATEVDAATQAAASAFADEAIQKQLSADKAAILAALQRDLASLGGQVAGGLLTSANAAAVLAQQYGITAVQAEVLINAQARLAAGEARLASQKTTKGAVDNSGAIGANAPGRRGSSDADVIATVTAAQRDNAKASDEAAAAQRRLDEARGGSKTTIANLRKDLASATVGSAAYIDTLAKIEAAEKAAAKTGAGAGKSRVDQAKKTNEELIKATEDYQTRIAQIDKDGAAKRLEAENSLKQAQLSGRAAFYASLAGIDDQALRQDLSARYESAAQAAAKIAETQGADAAEAYLAASQQQIEGEAKLQEQIAKERADGNTGQADYLQGVLDLQKAANAEELRQIQEKGSAVNNAQAAQYSEAERQYAEHLDRMNGIAASKGVAPGAATAPTATAAPAAASSRAQPVQDVATPPAIDSQTARLGGLLGEVITAVNVVAERVSSVERAIGGLKQSRATAGG